MNTRTISAVAAWLLMLVAAVMANLLVNHYGPSSTPYVAFALIGCDIVARDRLHLELTGLGRWVAIGSAIVVGSIITYALNTGAGDIALGSAVAFAAALTVDTVVFQLAARLDPQRRVNISNVFAAATDTLIFFAIAFGLSVIPFVLLFAQFTAKVAGGAIWSLLLVRQREEELYAPDTADSYIGRDAVLPRNS